MTTDKANVSGEFPQASSDSSRSDERKASFMAGLLRSYDAMRGRDPKELGVPFWDLVVLSAGSSDQAEWFRRSIELKINQGDLPLGVEFKVFTDPGDIRTGDGGATLHIIQKLVIT